MSQIKPSSHGIVVEHKESGAHYAISDRNYNSDVHRKVRDLNPGETVLGFKPLRKESLSDAVERQADKAPATSKTEGSASAGAQDTK